MKILAIGTLKSMTPHQQRKYMPAEVPATLKLYLRRKDGAVLASRRQRGGYLFDDRRLSQGSRDAAQSNAARRGEPF
jgi:hypothetical protein